MTYPRTSFIECKLCTCAIRSFEAASKRTKFIHTKTAQLHNSFSTRASSKGRKFWKWERKYWSSFSSPQCCFTAVLKKKGFIHRTYTWLREQKFEVHQRSIKSSNFPFKKAYRSADTLSPDLKNISALISHCSQFEFVKITHEVLRLEVSILLSSYTTNNLPNRSIRPSRLRGKQYTPPTQRCEVWTCLGDHFVMMKIPIEIRNLLCEYLTGTCPNHSRPERRPEVVWRPLPEKTSTNQIAKHTRARMCSVEHKICQYSLKPNLLDKNDSVARSTRALYTAWNLIFQPETTSYRRRWQCSEELEKRFTYNTAHVTVSAFWKMSYWRDGPYGTNEFYDVGNTSTLPETNHNNNDNSAW